MIFGNGATTKIEYKKKGDIENTKPCRDLGWL
jgi:hypothetical protein